ncbi:hypothetical protein Q7P37_009612 [Cladosporium fusiforme]
MTISIIHWITTLPTDTNLILQHPVHDPKHAAYRKPTPSSIVESGNAPLMSSDTHSQSGEGNMPPYDSALCQGASVQHIRTSAVAKVFSTTELVEQIYLRATIASILGSRAVCKFIKNVIDHSTTIETRLSSLALYDEASRSFNVGIRHFLLQAWNFECSHILDTKPVSTDIRTCFPYMNIQKYSRLRNMRICSPPAGVRSLLFFCQCSTCHFGQIDKSSPDRYAANHAFEATNASGSITLDATDTLESGSAS